MNLESLSKEISYALRHAPWEYELELDEEGFVPIEQLLHALNEGGNYVDDRPVTKEDLEEIIRTSDKKRHEIVGGRIRALYGHSVPQAIKKEIGTPPRILYHGTTTDVLPKIKDSGILPMNRQYVHLSTDQETARQVAARRKDKPAVTLLVINTAEAIANGSTFFIGNDKVWLADRIPPQCISIMIWGPLLHPSFVPLMDFPLDKYPECKMSVDDFVTEFPALAKGTRNDIAFGEPGVNR